MLKIGRKGQLWAKKETSYGVNPTLAATNAVRHINVNFQSDPWNRVTSPEKKQSPGAANRFDRRETAGLGTYEGVIRPSGTLGTVPEADPFLEAAFGSVRNVTLDTTLSGVPTTTGGTVADATGLQAGDAVLITVGTTKYVRVITDVSGSDLTWAPALPSAPTTGAALKGAIAYKLTTDLAISLCLVHSLPGSFARELRGVGIDQATLDFDGTEEARLVCQGPGKTMASTGVTVPAGFTMVGGNPPTGMVGDLWIGDTAYLHKTLEVQIKNGLVVRNVEMGNGGQASEVYRSGRREVTVSLESFAETQATLYDLAVAGTDVSVLRQNGRTEGNIVAVWMPRVEFKVPETTDDEEAVNWPFSGAALETADDANDEVTLILA